MKLEAIRDLKGIEILAKDILDFEGKILLKAGSKITRKNITDLKKYGIYFAYIEENEINDAFEDCKLNELKDSTSKIMPGVFNSLVNGDEKQIKESLNVANELIDYVIKEKSINTSLYEIKEYDDYTYKQAINTCIMSVFLGSTLKYSDIELEELATAAMFFDLGKLRIRSDILNKNGNLTKEEYEIVKKHPLHSKQILKISGIMSEEILKAVEQHHERVDGAGYPYGLKGDEICKYARVISVADVFTAVSSKRSYRDKFKPFEAYELILAGAGTIFDKEVVERFRMNFAVYPLGCHVKLSNGIEGFVVKNNKFFADRPIIRVIYDVFTKKKIKPYEIDLLKHINITVKHVIDE